MEKHEKTQKKTQTLPMDLIDFIEMWCLILSNYFIVEQFQDVYNLYKYVTINEDVLFLITIIKEFQNDRKSLHSCLLVDKTWCETTIPILWKNPWKICPIDSVKSKLLFNVIILHLS